MSACGVWRHCGRCCALTLANCLTYRRYFTLIRWTLRSLVFCEGFPRLSCDSTSMKSPLSRLVDNSCIVRSLRYVSLLSVAAEPVYFTHYRLTLKLVIYLYSFVIFITLSFENVINFYLKGNFILRHW